MSLSTTSIQAMHSTLLKMAKSESVVEDVGTQQMEAPETKPPHPLLTAAKRLGAYGAGTGVGYSGMAGAEALSKKFRGKSLGTSPMLRHALPVLTGAGALAFQHAQNSAFSRMRGDAKKRGEHVSKDS